MQVKFDFILQRISLVSAVMATVIALLVVMGSYQGFQDQTMKALVAALIDFSWLGTGTTLSLMILAPSLSWFRTVIFSLIILTFLIWTTLAMAWTMWLYA